MPFEKYEIAKIAVARDKHTLLGNRIREHGFVIGVRRDMDRADDVMPFGSDGAR